MLLCALRVLTVVALGVAILTPMAHAQTSIWSEFAPRLLPPTDNLAVRLDFDDRPVEFRIPTNVSLGRMLEGDSTVGLGVARLRPELGMSRRALNVDLSAGSPYRFIDIDLQQTAVSFDLKLMWPSQPDPSGVGAVQPYVSFGPAVFVAERNPFGNPLGLQADTAVRVGMKAEAGVTWRLDRNTALFSEYRFTRGGDTPILSSGGRMGPGSNASGFDLLYGVRFSY